jgi:transglutaminase-like putative cysteine protease
MRALAANLAHLRTLVPPARRPNLASNAAEIPMTEDEPYLSRQIKWQTIPTGRAGTRRTLQVMAELARQAAADPAFRKFMGQFGGISDFEDWVRSHFVYRDEHEETIRTPMFMLRDMGRHNQDRVIGLEGDCDDSATFLGAGAKVLGLPAQLTAIRVNRQNPEFEHVFAEAYSNGQWLTLDPTVEETTNIQAIESMTVQV